jgi:aspartyl-tRNA(Asn)/glutamyl-tRNA(Gln) amidotransferase subunit B
LPNYLPSIGLEVHAELNTRTKVFCGCSTAAGAPPNTQVCPICLGFPGVLPMLNRQVVEGGLRMALSLHCEITSPGIFERKGYYYPDLPKNFQISQKRAPLGRNGHLDLVADGESFRVRISDVHMEEDAAKLVHPEGDPDHSWVDFNRGGVPLLEIVSEPDMHSVAQAEAYMTAIRSTLLYLGISHARMEMGQVRFEASVSVAPPGAELGTRVEIKNLNSFRAVSGSIAHEIARQSKALARGESLRQETRLWDPERGVTEPMRSKETAMDYRYFPEPDLTPLVIDEAWIARVTADLPELAEQRRRRLVEQYALSEYDARILTEEKALADFFEESVKAGAPPKPAANWLTNTYRRRLLELHVGITESRLTPEAFAEIVLMVEHGIVATTPAINTIFDEIIVSGKSPKQVVDEHDLRQISDESALAAAVDEVIAEHQDAVENYRKGNANSLKFLVGQVMRQSKGRANPQLVNRLLEERLRS